MDRPVIKLPSQSSHSNRSRMVQHDSDPPWLSSIVGRLNTRHLDLYTMYQLGAVHSRNEAGMRPQSVPTANPALSTVSNASMRSRTFNGSAFRSPRSDTFTSSPWISGRLKNKASADSTYARLSKTAARLKKADRENARKINLENGEVVHENNSISHLPSKFDDYFDGAVSRANSTPRNPMYKPLLSPKLSVYDPLPGSVEGVRQSIEGVLRQKTQEIMENSISDNG